MIEKIKNNLFLVATLFGIFAVCTIFFPVVGFKVEGVPDQFMIGFSGLTACFGFNLYAEGVLEYSSMALLSYIAPVAGIIFLSHAEKTQEKEYFQYAFWVFLAGAILFFLMPSSLEYANAEAGEEVEGLIELGIGAIFGGVACVVSALCVLGGVKAVAQEIQQNAQDIQQNTQETQQITQEAQQNSQEVQ